jgi:hypothetical protein
MVHFRSLEGTASLSIAVIVIASCVHVMVREGQHGSPYTDICTCTCIKLHAIGPKLVCSAGNSCPAGNSCLAGNSCPTGNSCPAGNSCSAGNSFPAGNSCPAGSLFSKVDSLSSQFLQFVLTSSVCAQSNCRGVTTKHDKRKNERTNEQPRNTHTQKHKQASGRGSYYVFTVFMYICFKNNIQ